MCFSFARHQRYVLYVYLTDAPEPLVRNGAIYTIHLQVGAWRSMKGTWSQWGIQLKISIRQLFTLYRVLALPISPAQLGRRKYGLRFRRV